MGFMTIEQRAFTHTDPTIQRIFTQAFEGSDGIAALEVQLLDNNIPPNVLSGIFHTAWFTTYLEEVLTSPKLGFQAAALLTLTEDSQIRDLFLDHLGFKRTSGEIDVALGHRKWWLCADAEPLMEAALGLGQVVVLTSESDEPLLAYKFRGKKTALCVQSFSTKSGKGFVEGNWYSPVDSTTRSSLADLHRLDFGRAIVGDGKWAYMRQVLPTRGTPVGNYVQGLRNMTEQIPAVFSPKTF